MRECSRRQLQRDQEELNRLKTYEPTKTYTNGSFKSTYRNIAHTQYTDDSKDHKITAGYSDRTAHGTWFVKRFYGERV